MTMMRDVYPSVPFLLLLFAHSSSNEGNVLPRTAAPRQQFSSGPVVIPNARLDEMYADSVSFSREYLFQYQYKASEVTHFLL